MGWAGSMHGREKKYIQDFGGKTCVRDITYRMQV